MEGRSREPSIWLLGSEMTMTVYTSPEYVNLKEEKSCEGQHIPAGHLWEWLSKMMIRKTQGWEKASQRKHKIIVSNKTAHPFWCCEAAGWQHQLHIKTEFAISQSPGPSAHTTVTPLFHSRRKTELLRFSTFLACSFFSFKLKQKITLGKALYHQAATQK